MIVLENVTLSYERHPAVHHVSGCFEAGALTAIVGPNGAGKSTLLKALAGIIKPESGHIHYRGCSASEVAYLPQQSAMQTDFPMTVLEMVASGHFHRCGHSGAIGAAMREQARAALSQVGLSGFDARMIGTLSAGQFQRALFARLIVQDAKVILLDEPFNAIDEDTALQLMQTMLAWHKEGRTVVCVLHDMQAVERFFPHCVLLARECVGWGKTAEVMSESNRKRAQFFSGVWTQDAELCEVEDTVVCSTPH